jgi:hypothetical protein
MIHIVVAAGHEYTLRALLDPELRLRPLPLTIWTYSELFVQPELPGGTWIFSDLERLAVWELQLASHMALLMREAGPAFKVLNDPARAAGRYELLLRLHGDGFNRFRAWRAEDGLPPARYPVFVRTESDHGWPLSDLIHTPEVLASALAGAERLGIPKRGLLIIEFEAEAIAPGVYRKYGAYRIGDRIVADHMVHDVSWAAKYGNPEAWNDERYAEEAEYVRDNPHEEALRIAFELGGIDYGRADYGMVGGRPQVWEINTNPFIPGGNVASSPPQRAEATLRSRENRWAALEALDTTADGVFVEMTSDRLDHHRVRQQAGREPIRP